MAPFDPTYYGLVLAQPALVVLLTLSDNLRISNHSFSTIDRSSDGRHSPIFE